MPSAIAPHAAGLLVLPPGLTAQGIRLRGEAVNDVAFLERLYLSVRWEELAATDWSDEQKHQFLRWQFSLQRKHYLEHYYDAEFAIVENHNAPAGRLYLFRGARDIRIVDISLLPEFRGLGLGSALIGAVFDEAQAGGHSVSIHVEHFNPARRLYERLGFVEQSRDGVYALMEWRAA